MNENAPASYRAPKYSRSTVRIRKAAGNSLGILFLHHNVNDVVSNNLQSIERHNPHTKIVTVSADVALPGGYTMDGTPDVKQLHSMNKQRSSDWLLCSWFIQRKEKCRKWWIVEWDTYCTISVKSYYRPVWNFPFVASSVRMRNREPEWHWFSQLHGMPKDYDPYVIGGVPFLYLVSDEVLRRACSTLLAKPFNAGNGELRFSTAAHKCGFAPCGYSPPGDKITWIPWKQIGGPPAIFHPVKVMIPAAKTPSECRRKPV